MKAQKIFMLSMLVMTTLVYTGCKDEVDPLVEELDFDRVLGPANLTSRIRNLTTIELNWNLRDGADHYVVEFSEDSLEFGTIIFTDEVTADELPYQHTFAGETRYSARVKAVQEGLEDSNWAITTIETAQENIFLPLPGENVQDIYAILLWQAGAEVTHFLISPGNTERPITDDEKAAGEATLEDLSGSTDYTVTLYNGTKRRGVVTFSTQEAADIYPEDDLVAAIAAADEGAELVIAPGEYTTGAIAITKSITLKGQKPYDKPIIYGQLTCNTTVASITVESISFKGNVGPLAQFFNTIAGCNLGSLTIEDCEISSYTNGILYNNASGVYGSVRISNTYAHSMVGSGGDGIDFRNGTIGSLTVENSTFANAFRSFLRMQLPCTMLFKNCTMYKISTPDNTNNTGIFRASGAAGATNTLEVSNCLLVETGVLNPTVSVTSGNWCRNAASMLAVPTYDNNNIHSCYNLLVGLYTTAAQVSATELDPGFVDAANGDFTVTNQTIIDNNIGDPRWFQ